ncbi:tumor necrosis factor receptor superfamily member 11B-like [Aplochiton taeniatus]
MSAQIRKSNPAMKLIVLFSASLSWALQQAPPPKYVHFDPVTSEVLQCGQCPPGTSVLHHCSRARTTVCMPCPERHYTEDWHWGHACNHCTTVCKERQLIKQLCNSTHDQLCECAPGFHLAVEFCIKHSTCPPGTRVTALGSPDSDTVCEACPPGHFSRGGSSTEPCVPHRNCTELGLKTLVEGTPILDRLCDNQLGGKTTGLECSHQNTHCHTDVTLCEEAMFHSLVSLHISSVPLERVLESLPGLRVEGLRKVCSPRQQLLLLLRLWLEQNQDQDKLYHIIKGVKHCQRKVSRCASLKNLTLNDLLAVTDSLPGVKVHQEDVRAVVTSCPWRRYILQLLHLWKSLNSELELSKALSHSLRVLRSQGAPRPLLKGLKKISRIIDTASTQKTYHKMFVNMLRDAFCFKTQTYNE